MLLLGVFWCFVTSEESKKFVPVFPQRYTLFPSESEGKPESLDAHYFVKKSSQWSYSQSRQLKRALKNLSRIDRRIMKNLEKRHFPPALHIIGEMYELGISPYHRNLTKAYQYFERAAEGGYSESYSSLAFYKKYGLIPNTTNHIESLIYGTLGCEQMSIRSLLTVAYAHTFGSERPKSHRRAAKLLWPVAFSECRGADDNKFDFVNPERMSTDLHVGISNPNDVAILSQIKYAAKQGDKDAEVQLGVIYYTGKYGTEVNFTKAQKHFERNPDDPRAKTFMAKMKYYGQGMEKDEEDGLLDIEAAVQEGDPHAKVVLGLIKMDEKDYTGAADLFREAMISGHLGAAFNLAMLEIEHLVGNSGNLTRPFEIMRELMRLNVDFATIYAARMLLTGIHKMDEKEGVFLLWKAAQRGPWNKISDLAANAYKAGEYEIALQLWMELGDMGMDIPAFNAGLMLSNWQKLAPGTWPFCYDKNQTYWAAAKMFKVSYRMGHKQSLLYLAKSLLERGREDKAIQWLMHDNATAESGYIMAQLMLDADDDSMIQKRYMIIRDNISKIDIFAPALFLWIRTLADFAKTVWLIYTGKITDPEAINDARMFGNVCLSVLKTHEAASLLVFAVFALLLRYRIRMLYL